jgi:hypothetical protein
MQYFRHETEQKASEVRSCPNLLLYCYIVILTINIREKVACSVIEKDKYIATSLKLFGACQQ